MFDLFKKKSKDNTGKKEADLKKITDKVKKILNKVKLSKNEIKMIESIIKMDYLTARDVMIPRIDVLSLQMNAKRSELNKLIESSTFSRIPVYEGSIDNIKGILHVKDLFRLLYKNSGSKNIQVGKMLSDPYFVPEAKKISEMLNEFQLLKQHLAVVVDEYGGFAGIVTFEDILEVFIGDIQDEFDVEQDEIKKISETIFSIDARTDMETFNEYFDMELETNEADTIGGFMIMLAGYIPKLYQVITYEDMKFKVISKRKKIPDTNQGRVQDQAKIKQ